MEESNQFLEENAITYDTEADEKVIPEDVVYVYSGNAMNMEEVFQFSCLKTVEPVIVAGEQGSGKTTLEVMMYRLFQEGKNELLMFAGSTTMKGFRERSGGLMKKTGSAEPMVARTLRAEKKFLHLALCNGERKRQHLLFADYAGELFDERECLNELGEIFAGASNVVVTLDGEKLCDYKEKKKIILHAKVMLVEMQKAGILSKQTHLYIVCTKYDKIKNSDKKDAIIKFVNDKYQSLKESFAPNVGKMDLCYLYAYGIAEKEEREKMEELLLNFMKEDDFHVQERMEEEPIKVERQMDKFKMRG